MPLTLSDCPKIICSILLPPVGVFFETGCSAQLAINILLTLLGNKGKMGVRLWTYGFEFGDFPSILMIISIQTPISGYIPGIIHALYIICTE